LKENSLPDIKIQVAVKQEKEQKVKKALLKQLLLPIAWNQIPSPSNRAGFNPGNFALIGLK